jgi:homoserine dehydrogenase
LKTLDASGTPLPALDVVIDYLASIPRKVVFVDNTSSQAIAEAYPKILQRGISIVTPNKKAFSGTYELWQHIFATSLSTGALVYHESSVGAGMPIISTLNDIVTTGDKVQKIEGVFSGTMSYLFNSFAPISGSGGRWSEEVKKAKALGFTEPDPRDDLNGLDVARKLTILARSAGLPLSSASSFGAQNLIPEQLRGNMSVEGFLERLADYDDEMDTFKKEAEAAGKVVRFVGSVDMTTGVASVGLKWYDRSHSIANLQGSDNIISFYTERYGSKPLIIRGAGAGGQVTAMGVSSDLLKVVSQIL